MNIGFCINPAGYFKAVPASVGLTALDAYHVDARLRGWSFSVDEAQALNDDTRVDPLVLRLIHASYNLYHALPAGRA